MKAVELVTPLLIHGRTVSSFSASKDVMSVLGARSLTQLRDFFIGKIFEQSVGVPKKSNRDEIVGEELWDAKDLYYEFTINIVSGGFDIFAKISLDGVIDRNRVFQGCTFHVLDAEITMRDTK